MGDVVALIGLMLIAFLVGWSAGYVRGRGRFDWVIRCWLGFHEWHVIRDMPSNGLCFYCSVCGNRRPATIDEALK